MKRADKIRIAEEAAAQAAATDTRTPAEREAARQEWGRVRKAAREAFLAGKDWMSILNEFRETGGFYSSQERAKMCTAFADELVMKQFASGEQRERR